MTDEQTGAPLEETREETLDPGQPASDRGAPRSAAAQCRAEA